MIRDEKGRFVSDKSEESNESVNYGFYSKILNKPFDTLSELKEAESSYLKEEEAKKAKSLEKKNDATKVEDAFKVLNAAKREFNETVSKAKKEYTKTVAAAKATYSDAVDKANEVLEDAETKYDEALREFNAKHPEGYHVTLRDGDNVTTISRSTTSSLLKDFNDIFNFMFNF